MKTKLLLGAALLAAPFAADAQTVPPIRNVIVVINDGGGPTVYDAARMYKGARITTDNPRFTKLWVSTHPLRPDGNNVPGSTVQDPTVVYDSAKFWDTTPKAGASTAAGYSAYPAAFEGYEWSRYAHPDSGNTASSLSNGTKSYNNSINVDGAGVAQTTIIDLLNAARKAGKRTGVVTTVEFADATPAALGGAHNIARANRNAIANEMFSTGNLDVIGGAGNPDYDDNGVLRTTPNYNWISAALWNDLKAGTNVSTFNPWNFQLVQEKSDIDALAAGTMLPPEKLAMLYKSYTSSQFNRAGDTTNPADPHTKEPFTDALRSDTPSQVNLTLAALNALGMQKNAAGRAKGFYLMTEAGAVDRAEHANNTGRMIEEMVDSQNTVQAIIDWVNRADTDANWNNTLLIITADHDHLLYGPQGDRIPFQGLKSNGAGRTPQNKWFGPNHGTGLVPLFAMGKGSAELAALATNVDSYTDGRGRTFGHGNYLDQTDVGTFLKTALSSSSN